MFPVARQLTKLHPKPIDRPIDWLKPIENKLHCEFLTRFSVRIDDKVTDRVMNSEEHTAEANTFDSDLPDVLLEALSCMGRRRHDVMASLLLGELYTVYNRQQSTDVARKTVIADNGGHFCSATRCVMRPVDGTAFFFADDRAHVCIAGCKAPAVFHTGPQRALVGVLYVCESSGKPHMCTLDACDSVRHELDGSVVCVLTGKCLSDSKLTNGWIDDNWRLKHTPNRRHKRPSKKPVIPPVGLVGRKTKKCKVETHHIGRYSSALLSVPPPVEDRVACLAYEKSYSKSIEQVYDMIRPLLPGHPLTEVLRIEQVLCVLGRLVVKWHKAAKLCAETKTQLDFSQLHVLTQHQTQRVAQRQFEPEPSVVDVMAMAHCRLVVKYFATLNRHTNIGQRDVQLSDFAVALLYMQRTSFRVQNIVVIGLDVFLSDCLPEASRLSEFTHMDPSSFTSTKSIVQSCIMDAVYTRGVAVSLLVCPGLCFSDLLF